MGRELTVLPDPPPSPFSFPQTLQREVEGHQPRVDEVLERGRRMAVAAEAGGRPEARRIGEQLQELEEAWERLQDQMSKRRERLNGSNLAQQYYNDADEAEAWIGEQELYMIADEKAKVGGGQVGVRCQEAEHWLLIPLFLRPSRMSRAPC